MIASSSRWMVNFYLIKAGKQDAVPPRTLKHLFPQTIPFIFCGSFLLTIYNKYEIMESKPPLPPFTEETAKQKVRMAENAWNSKDPEKVSMAYTPDSAWRNRAEFLSGREAIVVFLKRKWATELDYRLIKELWAFTDNHIAARFAYEWHDDSGQWYRAYGNENWEFSEQGLMQRRIASINDLPIDESERKFFWKAGSRPDDHEGLSYLGF